MRNQDQAWQRIMGILGLCLLLFVGMFIRLVQIQLWKWPNYAAAAAAQRQSQFYRHKVSETSVNQNLTSGGVSGKTADFKPKWR